jgi:hypothetical protein
MIKKLMGLGGGGIGSEEVARTRFTRYMQPIVDPSLDAGALDSSQSWFLDIVDTGSEWRLFYTGANTQTLTYTPDGQDYINNDATFMAIKTKSNDVLTGWTKVLDVNSDPKPIFKPSFVGGRFDYWQVWIRTIISDGGGNLRAWFIGDDGNPTYDYRVGYATSTDWGDTWTKSGTTPIYTDFLSDGGSRGIVVLKVVWNGTHHVMIYAGVAPNVDGLKVVQSVDGITSWSVVTSGLFAGQEYGFPSDFRYISGTYYLWLQRRNMMPGGNLGPCREVVLFSSTDLTTWTNLGVQLKIHGNAQEFGIGNHVKAMQKPNGEWFMVHTYYINRTQALDALNGTKEPSPATKIAESNNSSSFIMNSQCDFSWPSYVTFHAPLDNENQFAEVISGTSGTLSSGNPSWWERGFLRLSGSQTVTFANDGVINGGNFGVKIYTEIITSGNRELFKIGNDIIVTLESGKLRVRLSSDGLGYEKDYITTANISKPTGMDFIDNHIYVAFHWNGTVLRMWNAHCVEEFTAGQITKTVDDAMTTVNNSGDNILIGQNAAIELRSVSITDGTVTELVTLNI